MIWLTFVGSGLVLRYGGFYGEEPEPRTVSVAQRP